ncbi:MAG: sugar phosphate isomerase/epimerase [Erysipelotrichaceae bacterium]|nr:sugar phosphate isomerase/epimerase [Erysipelotrichaceae bacterium]
MSLKIGIRGHDLPGAPFEKPEDMVEALKLVGIDTLQLVYKKGFKGFKQEAQFIVELADVLKKNDIKVAMIGAYFNMIHPDLEKRDAGKLYFKWCMETAFLFETKLVGSETGSANGDKWTFNEYNHTEEAFKIVTDTVKELNRYGREFKSKPIIEAAYAHTVYQPSGLKLLIDETEINDVTVDVYNYLNIDNYKDADKIFDECLELFKDKIRVFHLKDYNVIDGKLVQCAIGDGIMNWEYYIPKIKENCPEAYLILEGITGEDNIRKSVETVRRIENE